jgi:hypothetical protein
MKGQFSYTPYKITLSNNNNNNNDNWQKVAMKPVKAVVK